MRLSLPARNGGLEGVSFDSDYSGWGGASSLLSGQFVLAYSLLFVWVGALGLERT